MTELQRRCFELLDRRGPMDTTSMAYRLKTSRVAVVSAMRALERRGHAVSFRGGDCRWAPLCWGVHRARPSCALAPAAPAD